MRNILTILFIFSFMFVFGQNPKADSQRFEYKTTAQRDAYSDTGNYTRVIWNSDTQQFEYKPFGGAWTALGGGGSMTDAQVSAAFLNINPNTDLDSTNDLDITSDQTLTGRKTFEQSGTNDTPVLEIKNNGFGNNSSIQFIGETNTTIDVSAYFGLNVDASGNRIFSISQSSDLDASSVIRMNAVTGDLDINGQFSVNGVPISGGGGSTTLAGLTDVSLTAPADGRVLVHNGTDWSDEVLASDDVFYDNVASGLASTNVKGAIDELAVNGGNTNTSFVTESTDIELDNTHVKGPQGQSIIVEATGNPVFTLGDVITTNKWSTILAPSATDSVRLVPKAGFTFSGKDVNGNLLDGSEDGVTFKNFEFVNFIKRSATEFFLVGAIIAYNNFLAHPNDNNANPDIITGTSLGFASDNANVLPAGTGGSPFAGATEASIADTSNGYGNFVYQVTAGGTSLSRTQQTYTIEAGETYNYFIRYRMTVGSMGRIRTNSGFVTELDLALTAGVWTTVSGVLVADDTSAVFEPMATDFAGGAIGDQLQILMSLEKQ